MGNNSIELIWCKIVLENNFLCAVGAFYRAFNCDVFVLQCVSGIA